MIMKSVNPFTGEVIKEFDTLTFEKASEEIEKSRQSFAKWKEVPVGERVLYLRKAAVVLRNDKQHLAEIMTKEMGKPIKESLAEVEKCAWVCEYYADNAENFLKEEIIKTDSKKSYVRFDPLGVIFAVMPWNFPFWQVFRFAAPALAAGNVGILKHASNVPQCALAIEKVFSDSGLPEHVFKSLLIDSKVANQVIGFVDGVALTGSTSAGQKVGETAGKNIKKLVLELGGSDPFIVLDDADVDKAAKTAVKGRMINAGQSCIAAKRFIVHEKVAKDFEEKFVKYMKELKVGNPMDPETDVGPMAKEEFVKDIERQVNDARDKGAKILAGGSRLDGNEYFYLPTVISNVNDTMKVVTEETFGPVAPIIIVKNDEEAVMIANNTEFGLGSSIWTENRDRAERIASKIDAGCVFINDFVKSDPRLPFGGTKSSGIGRELSHYGLKEFVNIKTVVVN